jgi:hypothetical protein
MHSKKKQSASAPNDKKYQCKWDNCNVEFPKKNTFTEAPKKAAHRTGK